MGHYDIARGVQKILQDYKSLQDIIAILGMDELSEEDKLKVARAKRSKDSFLSHSRSLRFSPATPVSSSPLQKPSPDSRKSLRANTITSLKLLSTWLATLTKLSLRLNVWQLNVENKQAFSFGQTIACYFAYFLVF